MTAALLGALAIGLSLGLLGSGGSILTVPVLVYLLGQDEKTAIAGSLFVVGTIAAAGGLQYAWRRQVDWVNVLRFGLPGMAGTWLGARLAAYVSGAFQLAVFAVVMLLAAGLMLRPPGGRVAGKGRRRAGWKIVLDGLGVGLVTGFVGVGGGFLIVPALVLLAGLPMSLAVGTSLAVIALKSFTGLAGYVGVLADLGLALDWPLLALVAAVGIVGSVVGRVLGKHVPARRLQTVFAIFLIVVGTAILWQSAPRVL
ncbi:MAG TPA: sulfite exporter TauE/SafE family protein [Thermoanaerobaculia bacterium]|nr:sulfite exporter TauE/SafE family protein [Thermoanaerobaculia bacterium]